MTDNNIRSIKNVLIIATVLLIAACATTAQVEKVDTKVNDVLHQTEVNTVAIADLNAKVDRMYQKLLAK